MCLLSSSALRLLLFIYPISQKRRNPSFRQSLHMDTPGNLPGLPLLVNLSTCLYVADPENFLRRSPFGQSLHLDRISTTCVDPENFLYPSLISTLAKENITPTHLTTMTSFFKKKKQEEETQTTTCSSRAPICSFLFMSPKRIPYIQKPTSAPACSSSDRLLQSISQVSFSPLCLYS